MSLQGPRFQFEYVDLILETLLVSDVRLMEECKHKKYEFIPELKLKTKIEEELKKFDVKSSNQTSFCRQTSPLFTTCSCR